MEARYSVIRYVPDPARNEPINIGVVLQHGEIIDAKLNKEAMRRAVSSDPQADERALSRTESFIHGIVAEPRIDSDPVTGGARTIDPVDPAFLPMLASEGAGKVVISEPLYVDVPSADRSEFDSTLAMLMGRLARPLKRRPVFAAVESPPKRALRQALRPWISAEKVKVDHELPSRSGLPRVAEFYFENGRNYWLQNLALPYKRESQFFAKAESVAFQIGDVRRGKPDRQWAPIVICEFSADRAEEWVSQVKSVFDVVDCQAFDASQELEQSIGLTKEKLPAL